MKFSLATMATLTAASAKDLSIGMFNDDWEIEKKCSSELDNIQQALLAHVAEIMPNRFDDSSLKIPYDCPKYCADMPDWLCSRITRGYCSGSEANVSAVDPIEDFAEMAHIDDTYDCPIYCRDIPNWLCRRITNGHCTGNEGPLTFVSFASGDESSKDPVDETIPYHCPVFCQDVPDWVCHRITKGYCPDNNDSTLEEFDELPFDCNSVCAHVPDWVCRRISRGYCFGAEHRSLSEATTLADLVEVTVKQTAGLDNPFHCASYCADMPNWLCLRLTHGYCTGSERRGLTDEDTFDELVLENFGRRELPWHCPTYCKYMSRWLCSRLTRNYCSGNWNRYLASTEAIEETLPVEDIENRIHEIAHRQLPWHCPTYCKYMSRWWCEKLTRGYCWGNWNRDLVAIKANQDTAEPSDDTESNIHEIAHRQLPWHCPTYCRYMSRWWCEKLTRGYCWGNWNRDLAAIEAGQASTEPADNIENNIHEIAHRQLPWHCPTYCRHMSRWWCEKLTRGYCWGNWNRDLAAIEATQGTTDPSDDTEQGNHEISHRELPWHCPTYCKYMSRWWCEKLTRGYCWGNWNRDLAAIGASQASAESTDEIENNIHEIAHRQLPWHCPTYCKYMSRWWCEKLTRGYCWGNWNRDLAAIESSQRTTAPADYTEIEESSNEIAHRQLPWHCPTYCKYMSRWWCEKLTRGYCWGNWNRDLAAIGANQETADTMDANDDNNREIAHRHLPWHCPTYCKYMSRWWCEKLTRGYCWGNWNRDLAEIEASTELVDDTENKIKEIADRQLPWHCPTYCKYMSRWWCEKLTRGYCWGNWNRDLGEIDSSGEGRGLTEMDSPRDIMQELLGERELPWHCPTYCKYMSRWWCEKLTRGYCWGNWNRRELKVSTSQDTAASTFDAVEELTPEDFGQRELPWHCPTYCKYMSRWWCEKLTRGYCWGNWNRDLAVSDHSMTIVPDASGHQELPWDCDDFCSTIPGWLCRRLTFGYCSSSSGRNLFNTESSETEVSDDGEHREMPWHCPTYCKYMSRWWCEKLTRGYCWGNWNRHLEVSASKPQVSKSEDGQVPFQCASYCQNIPAWLCSRLTYGYCSAENSRHLELSGTEPEPVEIKLEDFGHRQLPYHCPTYCRRVPSWLCARLTYGYCSDGTEMGEEELPSLRGANSEQIDDDCDQAIAAMEAKFGEILGDLEDENCALAITKANVVFKCSRNEQAAA